MLVLSQKRDEEIVITVGGIHVVMSIQDIRSDKVRLGFIAPPEAAIHRREVWDAIQSAKSLADAAEETEP